MNEKVILITGASKGIGFNLVLEVLKNGYKVAATSRNKADLQQKINDNINDQKLLHNFMAVEMNFDEKSIQSAVEQVVGYFGKIDVLINNAGYAALGALEDISKEAILNNFDVNVFGLLDVCRTVIPIMKRNNKGLIINISSISGDVTGPAQGIYAATKAAVTSLSETLNYELVDHNIHSIAICPSGIRTDFLDQKSAYIDDTKNTLVRKNLEGFNQFNHNQSGNPKLVAKAILKTIEMKNPPLRLYLGRPAIRDINSKLDEIKESVNKYKDISLSIDD